ncbi:MAG: penicillin-binding protein, partial [Chloroflexota bacterium]|nr:penicillin-binding protein [Chloroflexota bacterium]
MVPANPDRSRVGRIPSHPATRVVALRHASRVVNRAADRPRSRWPRIVAAILVAVGLVAVITAATAALMLTTAVGVLSVGLPDPAGLQALTFAQPTVIYDRSGTVELGRFSREDRRVVAFGDVPPLVLDAATTAEDRTFWSNGGFDVPAIVSAVAQGASGAGERGASTITQQLVRARLLPLEVTGPSSDRYIRKAKEIIQSMRLSDAFPGELGKERVITAYLNEIFYGHGAYGIAAAAQIYFGVTDLAKLTPAQAALLAGLPKSPSTLDPFLFAVRDKKGQLVVPADSAPVVRRDWILNGLAGGARWTKLTPTELQAALAEPVVLADPQARAFKAAHFTWQVRRQLDAILGGTDAVETGGYKVITTLDWKAQQLAEKWLTAAAIVPNVSRATGEAMLKSMRIPKNQLGWIRALRGKDLHNGALVALDYKTGDVLAYAGSAGYDRNTLASPKFEPKFDVAGDGARQPGSAFKPIIYASAFDNHRLTPSSLLL